jgi:hypothetical protein
MSASSSSRSRPPTESEWHHGPVRAHAAEIRPDRAEQGQIAGVLSRAHWMWEYPSSDDEQAERSPFVTVPAHPHF